MNVPGGAVRAAPVEGEIDRGPLGDGPRRDDMMAPLLSAWPSAEIPATPVTTRFAGEGKTSTENRPISQANIVLGHGGIRRSDPDYYAVLVMNLILGGGGPSIFLAHKHSGHFSDRPADRQRLCQRGSNRRSTR